LQRSFSTWIGGREKDIPLMNLIFLPVPVEPGSSLKEFWSLREQRGLFSEWEEYLLVEWEERILHDQSDFERVFS